MAAQQECEHHKGRQFVLFCTQCTRPLCPSCVVGFECPATPSQQHEFSEVEKLPAFLRMKLETIQSQLSSEQSDLQKHATCFANAEESRDADFNGQVERVLQSRDEALQVIQQLKTAIRAASASAIVSVLRAGIESGERGDLHARALACRQQSCIVRRLRNLDDTSLLKELAFVRNLIRCAAPTAASPTSPAPSPAKKLRTNSEQVRRESGIWRKILVKI